MFGSMEETNNFMDAERPGLRSHAKHGNEKIYLMGEYRRLSLEKREQESRQHADLADPENEHPLDYVRP